MRAEDVVVTGCEYTGGLAALRGLRAAGFRPWAAVTGMDTYGAFSRAAEGALPIRDPRLDPVGFVDDLGRAASRVGARVVLPGTEAALLAVSEHVERLPPDLLVGAPDHATVLIATDKTLLPKLAASAGFQVPPTLLVDSGAGTGMADVRYPAMVKPLRSEQSTSAGLQHLEVSRVDTCGELVTAVSRMPEKRALVQPYLAGRIRTVNGVAWQGGVVVTVHKLARRTWPAGGGVVSNATTTSVQPELEVATYSLIRDLGWSGLFNLQFIETADGAHHLIDVNPRMYHSLSLAIRAGANLPAIWVSLMLGREPVLQGYRIGVHFRAEEDYYNLALDLVRNPGGALKTLGALLPKRRTIHPVLSLADPKPTLVTLRRITGKFGSGHVG